MEIKLQHKALVTGGAGFIGSHLCAELIARNWHVTALDIPSTNWWRHDALSIKVCRIEINMTDSEAVANSFSDDFFDCVFHLAAMTDVTRNTSLLNTLINENIVTTNNLLYSLQARADRIIVVGTCEEYGNGHVPFIETQREVAVSPYSWSKICTTHLAELYRRIFGVPVFVARPFLTYGPLQTNNMLIPSAIRAALCDESLIMTKGEQTRDFNFVSDIVDGLIHTATVSRCDEYILNLGSGEETTISSVVKLIYELCESSAQPNMGAIPYRQGETMHFFCNNNRVKESLGWLPRVTLREGLMRTIDWYRNYIAQGHLPCRKRVS